MSSKNKSDTQTTARPNLLELSLTSLGGHNAGIVDTIAKALSTRQIDRTAMMDQLKELEGAIREVKRQLSDANQKL